MSKQTSKSNSGYEKKYPDGEGQGVHRRGIREGFDSSGGVTCKGCFEKKLEIDRLRGEVNRLKQRLAYQEKKTKEGFFGNGTPSSQKPLKANSSEENQKKKGGACPGHKGFGRRSVSQDEADFVVEVEMPGRCDDCDLELTRKGFLERTIVDVESSRAMRHLYRLRRGLCPGCGKIKVARVPAMPRALYSNPLIAKAAVMHYVHGIPIGKVAQILGKNVTEGGLIESFHRMAAMTTDAQSELVDDFRSSPVKHADETSWRTDGKSGWVWLFCSSDTSIYRFGKPRSGAMVDEILGKKALPGVLVVDRFGGYNRAPCAIQYCMAHILREVEKLEAEFPDAAEVKSFVAELAPKLAMSMRLRTRDISGGEYRKEATRLRDDILDLARRPARHEGVRKIQRIFLEQRSRLFHWVRDPSIPAENNFAEREIRPTVIARKVSFGSQSERGAVTRSCLMSYLHTVRKRVPTLDIESWLSDRLAEVSAPAARNQQLALPSRRASRRD